MPTRTAASYLTEASELASNPRATSTDLGRAKVLTALAELASAGELDSNSRLNDLRLRRYAGERADSVSQLSAKAQARMVENTLDAATVDFFSGKRSSPLNQNAVISTSGGRIEEKTGYRINRRSVGAVSELRDFSLQLRTYTGLAEGTGSLGGYSVPVGFIPQVIAALKRTDQILEASDWDTAATTDGRAVNIPTLNDTSTSAVVVAEAGAQTFANPTFGRVQFSNATT